MRPSASFSAVSTESVSRDETSALIAGSFKFVRVDFYVQNNKLIIGECTFFPEGGMGLFDTRIQDEQIGAMFVNN